MLHELVEPYAAQFICNGGVGIGHARVTARSRDATAAIVASLAAVQP